MAKEDKTDGLSFWEHLDVLRTAIVKIVAVAVVFGIAAFCLRKNFCRYPCPEKRRLHHVPSFQPDCSMGRRRDREFCRAAHQHGTGRAVRHPHEDGIMRGCPVRVALYPLPVVPVRVACPVCLRAEICRADSRRRLCNVPDGCGGQLLSYFPADIPFPWNLSGQR